MNSGRAYHLQPSLVSQRSGSTLTSKDWQPHPLIGLTACHLPCNGFLKSSTNASLSTTNTAWWHLQSKTSRVKMTCMTTILTCPCSLSSGHTCSVRGVAARGVACRPPVSFSHLAILTIQQLWVSYCYVQKLEMYCETCGEIVCLRCALKVKPYVE